MRDNLNLAKIHVSTRLPSKKIHTPIWSMVALKGNYSFDKNQIIITTVTTRPAELDI